MQAGSQASDQSSAMFTVEIPRSYDQQAIVAGEAVDARVISISPDEIVAQAICRKHGRELLNIRTSKRSSWASGLFDLESTPRSMRSITIARQCPRCGEWTTRDLSYTYVSGGITCRHDGQNDALLFDELPFGRIRVRCHEQAGRQPKVRTRTDPCCPTIDLWLFADAVINSVSSGLTID